MIGGFYYCDQCGRKYKYKTGLRSHVRFECGKEPRFHCNICEYTCHVKSNLKSHILRRHYDVIPNGEIDALIRENN